MKINKVVELLNELHRWQKGETTIGQICLLLGDETNELGKMLMFNEIADFQYKPMEGISYQALVNAVLFYLAMRYAIK